MSTAAERQINQAAFRQMSEQITRTYPKGRFVAIAGGNVIGDASSFDELDSALKALGYHSVEVLVVQAGVEYPERAVIFL